VALPSGDEAALLTRYEDVKVALSDPRLSREGLASPHAARVAAGDSEGIFSSPMAQALNDEGHQRWRRMVGKWFTARRMSALRPGMEAMARHLITHTCAERERALAEGGAPLHPSWERTADALTDAIVGLLTAPVTPTATAWRRPPMKITVDEDKCCGAGSCVQLAPDVFDQRDDDGIVVLLDAAPSEEQHEAARESAGVCPAAAIHVSENPSTPENVRSA
jgi:ferredoxin